jgi:hypothetical protein
MNMIKRYLVSLSLAARICGLVIWSTTVTAMDEPSEGVVGNPTSVVANDLLYAQQRFQSAVMGDEMGMIRLLLDKGVNVDAEFSTSSIFYQMRRPSILSSGLMLAMTASNALTYILGEILQSSNHKRVLDMPTSSFDERRIQIFKMLLEHKANPNKEVSIRVLETNRSYFVPLLELVPSSFIEDKDKKQFISLLLEYGANPFVLPSQKLEAESISLFSDFKSLFSSEAQKRFITLYAKYPLIKEEWDKLEKTRDKLEKRRDARRSRAAQAAQILQREGQLPPELIKGILDIEKKLPEKSQNR